MHWLGETLDDLHRLSDALESAKAEAGVPAAEVTRARDEYSRALRSTVEAIARRPGINAAFVAHDGLVFASAGLLADATALTGLAQLALGAAGRAADGLALGTLRQAVYVGDARKLALFQVGQMTVGVLSAAETNLSMVLAHPG